LVLDLSRVTNEVFRIRFLKIISGTLSELYGCSESTWELYWNSISGEHSGNFASVYFSLSIEKTYWIVIVS